MINDLHDFSTDDDVDSEKEVWEGKTEKYLETDCLEYILTSLELASRNEAALLLVTSRDAAEWTHLTVRAINRLPLQDHN